MPAKASAEAVPEYPRLRARVEAFHAAMASGDDETAYGIYSPFMRALLPLDEFKQRHESYRQRTGPVQMIVHAVTPCYCGEVPYPPELAPTGKALRCVLLIDCSIVENGTEKRSRYLMAWDHTDGEWYYGIPHPEESEECPSLNN